MGRPAVLQAPPVEAESLFSPLDPTTEFELGSEIGRGHFGEVFQVRVVPHARVRFRRALMFALAILCGVCCFERRNVGWLVPHWRVRRWIVRQHDLSRALSLHPAHAFGPLQLACSD